MTKESWLACVGAGWHSIVAPLIDRAEKEGVEIVQVKEKFGGLRFYTGASSPEFQAAVDEAEALSYVICDVCGEPGEPRGGGWIRVLCDKHDAERNAPKGMNGHHNV